LFPASFKKLVESPKFREADPDEPLLFGSSGQPLNRSALSEAVSRIAIRAGITRIPVRSHVIRHSVATIAVDAGTDLPTAAVMLSHSNTATVSTYLHARASMTPELAYGR
jgi:integrase/recombinase XerD